MKQLVPMVQVLTAIAMSIFLVGCSATTPNEPPVEEQQEEKKPPKM
ncbi:MAG: hypothetical protein AAGI23_15405 [Bacteroidota bacterium]